MFRVSDQACSAHANLSQRYARRALVLELLTLAASLWLIAVAFVTGPMSQRLTPFNWTPQIWVGSLGVCVFFLTLLQTFLGWKEKAEAHRKSCGLHSDLKSDAGSELSKATISTATFQRLGAKYRLVGQLSVPIPEREFLKQKQHHKRKVRISKHLDRYPNSSMLLLRLRLWWRDNAKSPRP